MKKTAQLFFLLLFVNSFSGKAQQYVPLVVDSTHWFLDNQGLYPPPYSITEYFLNGDTIISSVNYKKVYNRTDNYNGGAAPIPSTTFSLFALIREDTLTKKVFTILQQNINPSCPVNQEILLYDFDIQIGDTLKTSELCLLLYSDVITNINPSNFWLSSNTYSLQMIYGDIFEGVGSDYGLFETIGTFGSSNPYLYDYCRGSMSNCKWMSTGIAQSSTTETINIVPNPILDYFTISSKENFEFEYTVFSVDRQLVKNGTGKSNINIPVDLKQGIYILQINNEKRQIHHTKKLIKLYN